MEHPRQPNVDRVAHAAGCARVAVVARSRLPDERQLGVGRPALGCRPSRRRAPRRPRSGPPSPSACGRSGPSCATGGAQDGALDLRVGAAAAEVAGHRLVDLLTRRLRRALEQRRRADDLARRAEPALESVLGDERVLHRGWRDRSKGPRSSRSRDPRRPRRAAGTSSRAGRRRAPRRRRTRPRRRRASCPEARDRRAEPRAIDGRSARRHGADR